MKNIRLLIFAVSVLIFLADSAVVFADSEDFKRAIWKDCALANLEASKLAPPERGAAVTFLKGIITLNLSTSENQSIPLPPLVRAPEGVMNDISLAPSLDPDRPNRAKKCAADILPILVPESADALPELLHQSEDTKIHFEVRAAFARSAFNLAQILSTNSQSPGGARLAEPLFTELFAMLQESSFPLIQEVLALFPEQLVDSISQVLLKSACEDGCSKEQELIIQLERVDLQNVRAKDSILNLIENSNPLIRIRLLQTFKYSTALYEGLLNFLLPRLEQSSGQERSQIFQNLNSIFDYELRTASLAVDPDERLRLVAAFAASSSEERDCLEKGLAVLAPLYPEFTPAIKVLAISQEEDLRLRAARLLSRVISANSETRKLLIVLLNDESIKVRQVALFSSIKVATPEVLLKQSALLQQLIEKQTISQAITNQQSLSARLELLRFVGQLSVSVLPSLWTRNALNAIDIGLQQNKSADELIPALAILETSAQNTINEIKNFARSKEVSRRNAAIFILQRGGAHDASVADILLTLLSDSDPTVSQNAQIALLATQPDLAQSLNAKKLMAPSPRLEELALEAGLKPELESEVTKRMSEVACEEISRLSQVCLPRPLLGTFCGTVVAQIPRCIDQGILTSLPTGMVEKAIGLQSKVKDLFTKVLFDLQTSRSSQLEIGLFLLRAKISEGNIDEKLCDLGNIATQKALNEIVSAVSSDPKVARLCLESFKKQFEDSKISSAQKALLFKEVLLLDPDGINVPELLKDALEQHDLTFLRVIAHGELVNDLLPILGAVLTQETDSSDEQDRLIALQLIEELGEKAVSQIPAVNPLLDAPGNDVRYRAARAIIAINADRTASLKALRSIINSPNYHELLLSPGLGHLEPLVQTLVEEQRLNLSASELRNLLRLLKVLRGPDAVVAEAIESLEESNDVPTVAGVPTAAPAPQ